MLLDNGEFYMKDLLSETLDDKRLRDQYNEDIKAFENLLALGKTGQRYNKGKSRHELVPPDGLAAIVDVFSYGAIKYSDRNWELGMPWMTMVASLKRHLNAWEHGELLDNESGLPHLAHATWNALALLTYELRGIGTDDRPKFWAGVKQTEMDI